MVKDRRRSQDKAPRPQHHHPAAPTPPVQAAAAVAAAVAEPEGTSIAAIVGVGDRLAVQLRGGGPERVIFVAPHTATVSGRFSLGK